VTEPQPASDTVTPGLDRNAAVRQRLIRETMERLRVDHDCDHTSWKFRRGGGRCESCESHLPFYLFVSRLRCVAYFDTPSDLTSISVVRGVKCTPVTGVAETVCKKWPNLNFLDALLIIRKWLSVCIILRCWTRLLSDTTMRCILKLRYVCLP
jgi:hypothetical protein